MRSTIAPPTRLAMLRSPHRRLLRPCRHRPRHCTTNPCKKSRRLMPVPKFRRPHRIAQAIALIEAASRTWATAPCPLRVKSRHRKASGECPLFPNRDRESEHRAEHGSCPDVCFFGRNRGKTRSSIDRSNMVANDPKADIERSFQFAGGSLYGCRPGPRSGHEASGISSVLSVARQRFGRSRLVRRQPMPVVGLLNAATPTGYAKPCVPRSIKA